MLVERRPEPSESLEIGIICRRIARHGGQSRTLLSSRGCAPVCATFWRECRFPCAPATSSNPVLPTNGVDRDPPSSSKPPVSLRETGVFSFPAAVRDKCCWRADTPSMELPVGSVDRPCRCWRSCVRRSRAGGSFSDSATATATCDVLLDNGGLQTVRFLHYGRVSGRKICTRSVTAAWRRCRTGAGRIAGDRRRPFTGFLSQAYPARTTCSSSWTARERG